MITMFKGSKSFHKLLSHDLTNLAGTGEKPGFTTNGLCTGNGATDVAPTALKGEAAWTALEDAEKANDGIGVEKVDTKEGTTKLFCLPETRGVALAILN